MKKIKSCPFCGGEATFVVFKKSDEILATCSVFCTKCNIMIGFLNRERGTADFFNSPHDAEEFWNTRKFSLGDIKDDAR